jgi:hypothetical protein
MALLEFLTAAAVTGIVAAQFGRFALKGDERFVTMTVVVIALRAVLMLVSGVGCGGFGLWHGAVVSGVASSR